MNSAPLLRFVIAGQLRRDYILLPDGKAGLDIPGGSLLYAAAGLGLWENSAGLIGRVGEDYPQEWLDRIARRGFDVRGIRVLPEPLDLRWFGSYPDGQKVQESNPIAHFSQQGLSFPLALLGYSEPAPDLDSRNQAGALTIRVNDFPADYQDATAAHLCPMDFLSHSLLPPALRRGNVNTITLDPGAGYMNPTFWDDLPSIIQGISAFLSSEEKVAALFQSKVTDLWEMAEALAGMGCELIVIKRGARGQYLYDHSRHARWIIPAYPARVVDPTGAGDAFCGGFLAGFRSTYDPLQACLYGNVAASFAIEGMGPFYALDAMSALVQARLDAMKEMARKI